MKEAIRQAGENIKTGGGPFGAVVVKDGKIIGRSSSWVGNVGANDFQIEDVINGNDIYLTIDI